MLFLVGKVLFQLPQALACGTNCQSNQKTNAQTSATIAFKNYFRRQFLSKMKKHIPNAITLANLFSGCCALVFVLHGQISTAAMFTAASLVLDWLDGTAARRLKVASPLGGQLDSMADMVSFGVVPSAILYQILASQSTAAPFPTAVFWPALPVFVLTAFSGLRLAKFNLDSRQTDSFIGLPTPACTTFVLGLGLAWEMNTLGLRSVLGQNWLIYGVAVLFSGLLVAEIPMFSLKLKPNGGASSWLILVGSMVAAGLLFWFLNALGLSVLILGYIFTSIIFFKKT